MELFSMDRKRAQFSNFFTHSFRKLLLTLYASFANEPPEYRCMVPAQWHISNIKYENEAHYAGWE